MKLFEFPTDIKTWQPIESAPKDGTPLLSFSDDFVSLGAFYDDGRKSFDGRRMGPTWICAVVLSEMTPVTDHNDRPVNREKMFTLVGEEPTHWMPLPSPPEQNAKGEK